MIPGIFSRFIGHAAGKNGQDRHHERARQQIHGIVIKQCHGGRDVRAEDIQSLFKETIAEFMEDWLEAELTQKLGCNK